jgi:hypothetical protein
MVISFEVNGVSYTLPEIITLEMWEHAVVWDLTDDRNIKPFVAGLIGCTLAEINQLEESTFGLFAGVCIQRMTIDGESIVEEINGYKLTPFDDLTFGNWVDIDVFISNGVQNNLALLASIIYNAPLDIVKDWDVKLVGPTIMHLSKWRTKVYHDYEEFFELEVQETDIDGEPLEGNEVNLQLMWYQAILALADSDFLKIHQVVERPYREALNFLTWKKDQLAKEKLENLKLKNQSRR